jgi:predicted nucleic acid-binding Zn ribbon protein
VYFHSFSTELCISEERGAGPVSTWRPSEPPPGERDPRRISELLDRTTRRLGGPSSGTTTAVFSRWEELVGPDIAAHSHPVSLHDGVLTLAVDHPAWATQLRFMTAELLTRIGDVTAAAGNGEVREIRLRVTGQPTPETPFRGGRKRRF